MQIARTDTELIEAVLTGDQQAYAGLVRRHQRFVFTLAMRFARSREDAEEISQDCFVKAYRSLHTFQRSSRFTTWLYSIVYTTAMTFLRKKRLNTSSLDEEGNERFADEIAALADHCPAEQKSRSVYINKAVNLLLPDDAAIITLFYQGEQSLEEIGKALHMETNTVKVKLHRARQRFREKLEHLLKHEAKELI